MSQEVFSLWMVKASLLPLLVSLFVLRVCTLWADIKPSNHPTIFYLRTSSADL